MTSHPLASLSPVERNTYRTALAAQVVETVYRAAQHQQPVTLDDIVLGVQALRPGAPTVEIHRAVAHVEYAGLIRPTITPAGHWEHVSEPGSLPHPLQVCKTPECLRPAGHDEGHLPDLNGDRFAAQLAIPADNFVAAWSPGAPWVNVYATSTDWVQGNTPVAVLTVPHTMRFTPDSLVALVTAWTSSDDYVLPVDGRGRRVHWTMGEQSFAYEPGVDNGTLTSRHADFFAAWDHDHGEVRFYESADAYDCDPDDPIDRVDVPADAPFSGPVLDQICEDWFEREAAKERADQDQSRS